jgi:type IV pilus biogenesis protein CpaD/CtpE
MKPTITRTVLLVAAALLLAGCTKTIKEADAGHGPAIYSQQGPMTGIRS